MDVSLLNKRGEPEDDQRLLMKSIPAKPTSTAPALQQVSKVSLVFSIGLGRGGKIAGIYKFPYFVRWGRTSRLIKGVISRVLGSSVSGPFHFDTVPDPYPRIRIVE